MAEGARPKVCIRQRIGVRIPSPPYLKKSSYESASFFRILHWGMRSPDRGSTTGAASWTDHEHSEWAARRASEESIPSPPYLKKSSYESASFFAYCTRGDEKPRPGSTTGAASWTDHEHSEWAARRASEASQSPHRHIQRRARTKVRAFSHIALVGMRSPDRGSTTGAASWTDHEHSEWAARRASEASQSPHRHI